MSSEAVNRWMKLRKQWESVVQRLSSMKMEDGCPGMKSSRGLLNIINAVSDIFFLNNDTKSVEKEQKQTFVRFIYCSII